MHPLRLRVRLPEVDRAPVVVAVALIDRAEVEQDRHRRDERTVPALLRLAEDQLVLRPGVVERRGEGRPQRPVPA